MYVFVKHILGSAVSGEWAKFVSEVYWKCRGRGKSNFILL